MGKEIEKKDIEKHKQEKGLVTNGDSLPAGGAGENLTAREWYNMKVS